MFTNKRAWQLAVIVLWLSLGAACTVNPALAASSQKSNRAAAEGTDEQKDKLENEIRDLLIQFSAAVNDGDAAKIASYWSEDSVFIDESGEEIRGHSALLDRFSNAVKERGALSLEMHPERISFPALNVALVVGAASRKNAASDLPTTRFSMVLQKHNEGWLISEATETRMQGLKASDYLKDLDWLIGKWQVDNSDNSAKLEIDWGASRNFIISKCLTNNDGVQQVDTQIIGWDPRSKGIVSWHFDCNGGFGYGKWSKQTNGWSVDFAGVGADGSSMKATNVFEIKNPEEFVWHSSQQSSDGAALADTQALNIKKQTTK